MSTVIDRPTMTRDAESQEARDRAMLRTLMTHDHLSPLDMAERIGGLSASEVASVVRGEPVSAEVHRRIHRFLETPGPEWITDVPPETTHMPPERAHAPHSEREPLSPAHATNPDIAELPAGFVGVRNQRGRTPYQEPVLILTFDSRLRLSSEAIDQLGHPKRIQIAVSRETRQVLFRVNPDLPESETFAVNGYLVRTSRIGGLLREWGLTTATPYPLVPAHGGLLLEVK